MSDKVEVRGSLSNDWSDLTTRRSKLEIEVKYPDNNKFIQDLVDLVQEFIANWGKEKCPHEIWTNDEESGEATCLGCKQRLPQHDYPLREVSSTDRAPADGT